MEPYRAQPMLAWRRCELLADYRALATRCERADSKLANSRRIALYREYASPPSRRRRLYSSSSGSSPVDCHWIPALWSRLRAMSTAQAAIVRGAGGLSTLSIEFAAPSPVGLLQTQPAS